MLQRLHAFAVWIENRSEGRRWLWSFESRTGFDLAAGDQIRRFCPDRLASLPLALPVSCLLSSCVFSSSRFWFRSQVQRQLSVRKLGSAPLLFLPLVRLSLQVWFLENMRPLRICIRTVRRAIFPLTAVLRMSGGIVGIHAKLSVRLKRLHNVF
jgi:hypothetical protein